MSTASGYLTVGGLNVDVVSKDIKNLHIGVYPPVGRVRVAAPKSMDDEQIRLAVIRRLPWIQRQRRELMEAERQSKRAFVNGESHYVWGRRRRLRVVEAPGRPSVTVSTERITLTCPAGTDAAGRTKIYENWQRRELRSALTELLDRWQARIGREPSGWNIRRMKTKWGTCSRNTGRLSFNLELAKKHPRCVEYIVVHELVHLIEPGHGDRFLALMDEHLPDWRSRRDELNASPLAEEQWQQ